jgi:hypothetical protein
MWVLFQSAFIHGSHFQICNLQLRAIRAALHPNQ